MSYKAMLNYLYRLVMGVNNSFFRKTVMADGLFPSEINTFTVWTSKKRLWALFAQVQGNFRFTAFD
jgi:hypothetical protein